MNYIKRHELRKQREKSAHLFPIIASNDGYVLTADERILLRFAIGANPVKYWRTETKELGLDTSGITPEEAYAVVSRLTQMSDLEEAALELQRKANQMRNLLLKVYSECKTGDKPNSRTLVDIIQLIRDTEE